MKLLNKIITPHIPFGSYSLWLMCLVGAIAVARGLYTSQPTNGYAGVLSGSFQVSGSGDARYVIDIATPPGTNAMEPSLSIVYASAAGEGLLGNGWRLNGLSVINRVVATEDQDGFVGSLNFDANDRFALDGSRLMNTQGEYGSDGSVYHTEMESWTQVVAHGDTCGSGPCWFQVTDRNGVVKEYGRTDDSRIHGTNGKGVRVWALNKITDLNGNYLTVTYQQEPQNGSYYPLSIDYSGNTNTGYAPMRHVYFDYEARPDVITLASGGGIIRNTQLLKAIRTEVQGTPVLTYQFSYTQSASTSKSLLQQVQECAANGACLPPIQLQWSALNSGLIDDEQQLSVQMDQGQLIPLDINGDGLMDLANIKKKSATDNFPTIIESWLSNGSTYLLSGSLNFSNTAGGNFYAADFNADGRLDLAKCITSGKLQTQVFLSTGENYRASEVYNGPSTGIYYGTSTEVNFNLGDVNGDSKTDLIYGVVKVFNGYSQVQITNFIGNDSAFSPLTTQSFNIETQVGGKLYAGDFNADSKTDLAYVTTQLNTANALQSAMLINNLDNQYSLGDIQSFPFYKGSSGQLILGDVNGDGNTDMVYSYLKDSLYLTTLLSNGNTLFLSEKNHLPYPGQGWIMPQDINGDGLTDLTFINASNTSQFQFYIYPSDGSGYDQQVIFTEQTTPASYNPIPMDINGDALTDLLYVKSISGNVPKYNFSRFMASGPYPDLLIGINNGIGGQISVNYKPLTDTTIYKKTVDDTLIYLRSQLATYSANSVMNTTNGATYTLGSTSQKTTQGACIPAVTVQFPKYCVASYQKSGGIGAPYGFSLFYAGAKVSHKGRGWLGFAQKTLIDSNLQVKAKSYFHQAFPLTGQIATSQIFDLQNNLYRRYGVAFEVVDSTYAATQSTTAQVLHKGIRTAYYDKGEYAYTTGQDFRYDTYGNTILNINYGDMATPNTCVYTISQYLNDPVNWRLGYLRQQLMSSDSLGSDTLYLQANQYDPTTYTLRERQYWDDSQQTFVDSSFLYDPYGNITTAILPNGDSTFIVYEDVYHSFVSAAISPRNQWGKRLKTQYRHEPYFGLLVTSINPNGDSTVNVFDALGRDSLTYSPDPSGKMVLTAKNYYLPTSSGVGYQTQSAIRLDWDGKKWDTVYSLYNGFNQPVKVTNNGQNNKPVYTDIRYNSRNKIIAKSIPYYEGDQAYWHRIQYDPTQRITQVTGPKGYTDSVRLQISYSGKSVRVTEAVGTPNQSVSTMIYDFYNSQKSYTHLINKNGDTTRIYYDLMANMVLFEDPSNIKTRNTYNTLGNTIKTEDASMGTFWYAHDYAKGYSQVINSLQDTTKLWFDGMNRLILQEFEDGTTFSLEYDLPQNQGSLGALSKAYWNANSYYSYHYDRNGQIAAVDMSYEGVLFQEEMLYNADGSPAEHVLPDSSIIAYTYSSQSLLESIKMMDTRSGSSAFKTYASFTEFDASDNVLQANYGNQTQTNFSYFPAGRINTHQVSNAQGSFIDDDYNWNYVGMLDSIIDGTEAGDLSQFFKYDPAQRLLNARGLYGSKQYSYDASGNLKLKDSINYTYTGMKVSAGTYHQDTVFKAKYDVLGNMTEKLQITGKDTSLFQYRYNKQNLLSVVIKNADTLYQFTYDYEGRRITKVDYEEAILSLYVSENYDVTFYPDSTLTTKYIQTADGLIASVTHSDSQTPTSAKVTGGMPTTGTLYFHQNNINSTLYVTDEQGQPVSRMVYTPYGSIYQQSAGGADNFRYKFAGKELDEADGLYYFNARYYDPSVGRFTTADTELGGAVFKADVLNRYAYTLNNPVVYMDPSGHGAVGEAILDVAVIGFTVAVEVGLDVVTAGAAIPEELAVDAGIVGAEVTADVTADALVDAGIDATTEALSDLGTESMDDTFFDILGEGSEESTTGDATSRLEFNASQESCMCLTGSTEVQTTTGTKSISAVGIGDTLLAYNEHTAQSGPYRVRMLYERTTDSLLHITIGGEVIETTPNHPFWREGRWVPAGQLKVGDTLIKANGEQVKIQRIALKLGSFRVYNLEVAEAHTYYASLSGILVHNGVKLCGRITRGKRETVLKRYGADTNNIIEGKRLRRPPIRFGQGITRYGKIYPRRSYARFVNFGSRVQREVRIEFTGNLARDFRLADEKAGINASYRRSSSTTWHHHTDVKLETDGKYYGSMQLIDQQTHRAYPHYGGESIYRKLVGSGYGR